MQCRSMLLSPPTCFDKLPSDPQGLSLRAVGCKLSASVVWLISKDATPAKQYGLSFPGLLIFQLHSQPARQFIGKLARPLHRVSAA